MTLRCCLKDMTVPLLEALRLADLRLGRRKLLKSPVSSFLQSYPVPVWLVMIVGKLAKDIPGMEGTMMPNQLCMS